MRMLSSEDGTYPMLGYGALGGVATYLLGFLVTYVWKAPAVADALRGVNLIANFLGIDAVPTWRGVGWLFYNAHFVQTRVPGPGGPTFTDFLARTEQGWLLTILVPVLLIAAGAVVAHRTDGSESIGRAAIHGGAVGVGYLPLAAAGAVLTAQPIADTGAKIGPDLIPAVLLAGLAYPLLFGAIGGALFAVIR